MKILVGIPCMDMMHTKTVASLFGMTIPEGTDFYFHSGSVVHEARNNIAINAIKEGYDYVLWIDSDMVIPADALTRLLNDDKDMAAGFYHKRQLPAAPVVYIDGKPVDDRHAIPEDIFECDAVGFGCVLTKVSLLAEMVKCGLFHPAFGEGEDISFCRRVKENGYKIYCDPNVKCGHLMTYEV